MKWGIQLRLTALVLAASVVVLATAFFVLHRQTVAEFESEFHERAHMLAEQARAQLVQLTERLSTAVRRVSVDPEVGFVDSDLAWDQLHERPDRLREVRAWAAGAMKGPDLDALFVVDRADGRVVALGHRIGLPRARPSWTQRLRADAEPAAWVDTIQMELDGRLVDTPALLVGHSTGRRVSIVGGWRLDPERLSPLLAGAGAGIRLVLVGPEDAPVAASSPQLQGVDAQRVRLPWNGAQGVEALVVEVSSEALTRRLDGLLRLFGGALAMAFVLALLLGTVASRRVSRPIRELAAASTRVAEGDWGATVATPPRTDELGELVTAFNAMSLDLADSRERALRAERVAAWRDVARQIAHEVKNPLFPIQTSIETLQRARARRLADFDEIFDESTTLILGEVERIKRIVTAFSRFAQLPAPRLRRMDGNELVAHVHRMYRDAYPTVEWKSTGAEPGLVDVLVDEEQMIQVLTNLVINAVDSLRSGPETAPSGRISVTAVRDDGGPRPQLVIWVDDSGGGVPVELRERVFRPYVSTKSHGSGLGLAIAHRIVTEHEGSITVTESPQGGARFEVRLNALPNA